MSNELKILENQNKIKEKINERNLKKNNLITYDMDKSKS